MEMIGRSANRPNKSTQNTVKGLRFKCFYVLLSFIFCFLKLFFVFVFVFVFVSRQLNFCFRAIFLVGWTPLSKISWGLFVGPPVTFMKGKREFFPN